MKKYSVETIPVLENGGVTFNPPIIQEFDKEEEARNFAQQYHLQHPTTGVIVIKHNGDGSAPIILRLP